MFTWTYRFGLALLGLLAGCGQVPDVTSASFGFSRAAPHSIAVANRSVVIAGPPGYCIDKPGSKLAGDSAFVVLASCATITRDASVAVPGKMGLLTATVAMDQGAGPGLLSSPDVLQAFLASPGGRAAMARDGRVESVKVLTMLRADDAILIRLRDTSQSDVAGVEDVYWRGLADLNGRLVTISVVSFADKPLGPDQGLATLRAFLAQIRAETPTRTAAN